MQDLEESAINKLLIQPLFYYRYVDDIILALSSDTLNIFNSLHSRLQFTMKINTEKGLNFLFKLKRHKYNY